MSSKAANIEGHKTRIGLLKKRSAAQRSSTTRREALEDANEPQRRGQRRPSFCVLAAQPAAPRRAQTARRATGAASPKRRRLSTRRRRRASRAPPTVPCGKRLQRSSTQTGLLPVLRPGGARGNQGLPTEADRPVRSESENGRERGPLQRLRLRHRRLRERPLVEPLPAEDAGLPGVAHGHGQSFKDGGR